MDGQPLKASALPPSTYSQPPPPGLYTLPQNCGFPSFVKPTCALRRWFRAGMLLLPNCPLLRRRVPEEALEARQLKQVCRPKAASLGEQWAATISAGTLARGETAQTWMKKRNLTDKELASCNLPVGQ